MEECRKACADCEEEKPLSQYHTEKNKRDGRQKRCKTCVHREYKRRVRRMRKVSLDYEGERTCTRCKRTLPKTDFRARLCSPDGFDIRCSYCRSASDAANNRRLAANHRQRMAKAKRGQWCVMCTVQDDPALLEFDHVDPRSKKYQISKMDRLSDARFYAEVSKTQFLCVRCHRRKSVGHARARAKSGVPQRYNPKYEERNRLHVRERKIEMLAKGGCAACGKKPDPNGDISIELACFDFDHIVPATKKNEIAMMAAGCSIKAIDVEIAKCRLICCDCHMLHTREQQGYFAYDAHRPASGLSSDERGPLLRARRIVDAMVASGVPMLWRDGTGVSRPELCDFILPYVQNAP